MPAKIRRNIRIFAYLELWSQTPVNRTGDIFPAHKKYKTINTHNTSLTGILRPDICAGQAIIVLIFTTFLLLNL